MVQGTNFPPVLQQHGAKKNYAVSLHIDNQNIKNCIIILSIELKFELEEKIRKMISKRAYAQIWLSVIK